MPLFCEFIYISLCIINQKTNGKLHYLNHSDIEVPNEYFMTTNEMLEAFDFLEDKEDVG